MPAETTKPQRLTDAGASLFESNLEITVKKYNTSMMPFNFEACEIRVITHDDGSFSVVGKDVAEALGYTWSGTSRVAHVPEEWRGVTSVVTPSGEQEMITLTESGLYFFLGRSDKPKAIPFQKWIFGDVAPSIRQTGSYTLPKAKPTQAPAPDAVMLKHRQAKSTLNLYLSAAKLLGTDEPMARAVAVDAVKKQTGVDFLPLLAGNTIEEKPITPTELGKLRGWSAKETNVQLALAGLQIKNGDGEWVPTDIGRIYCTCNPYKAPHSQHTGYRTLWYRSVLDVLDNRQQEAA